MNHGIAKRLADMPQVEGMPRNFTIREQLEQRKQALEENLQNVVEAIQALDSSPEFEKVHNAVQKAGY